MIKTIQWKKILRAVIPFGIFMAIAEFLSVFCLGSFGMFFLYSCLIISWLLCPLLVVSVVLENRLKHFFIALLCCVLATFASLYITSYFIGLFVPPTVDYFY